MVLPDYKVALTKQLIQKLLPREELRATVKRLTLPYRKTLSWSLLSHNAILHS